MKSTNEILREAAEYIGEHGWCQGRLQDDDGRVCTLGAINAVHGTLRLGPDDMAEYTTNPSTSSVMRRLEAVAVAADKVARHLGISGLNHSPVAIWNDTPERTAEDVILALKRAAEELD